MFWHAEETAMNTLGIAFAGTFAPSLEGRVRARLTVPCEVGVTDEASAAARMPDVDVLVTTSIAENIHRIARGETPANLIAT